MELSGYFAVLRRWWWTLIVAVWVAGLAGFVLGSQVAPTYETRIRLLVGPINTDIETLRAAGQLVQTYSELTTSQPLLESVSRELALPISTGELRSRIRSTADDVTRLLTIRVVDEDPERAVAIASTLGDELIQLAAGGTTRPEGELQTVDFPETPTDPIAPQMSLIVLLAALGGLVTAVVVVLLVEYVSDAVRGREDLERLIPAPYLGQATLEETAIARTHRRLPTDGQSAATYRQALAKIERSSGGSAPMLAIFGPAGQPAVSDAVVAHRDRDRGVVESSRDRRRRWRAVGTARIDKGGGTSRLAPRSGSLGGRASCGADAKRLVHPRRRRWRDRGHHRPAGRATP